MIVPVGFEIARACAPEDFTVEPPLAEILRVPATPIHVTIKLYNTETRHGLQFSGRVVTEEDETHHELGTLLKANTGLNLVEVEYLRNLRDAINKELGEEG